jgi:hypothetical protein
MREPGSFTLPILVGFVVFSTSSKKQQTPLQSCGTLLRAFFAVRKQSPPQVTPVEWRGRRGNTFQISNLVPGSAGSLPAPMQASRLRSQGVSPLFERYWGDEG